MDSDVEIIFERLRSGIVPERGLHYFEVGTEKTRGELRRQLDLAAKNQGAFKFLRGGYGCGKTFSARLAFNEALERNFAASFVVVSDNDLRFYKFDELYRKIVSELATSYCPRGALGQILDRWIGHVEDGLVDLGEDEDSPEFDAKVLAKIESQLYTSTGGAVPDDMIRVLKTIFQLKQERNQADAGALVSWLSGGQNVAARAKSRASIKGDIESSDALRYLRGILEIVKLAKLQGLVVVVDEVETILRSRGDVRKKSLNGIRQIYDDSDGFKGLFWIFTGTPEFFDSQRGVAGLSPLHDRIKFSKSGKFVNVMQPQLELPPFDEDRLAQVARNLRRIYPNQRERLETRVRDAFIDALVRKFTEGFKKETGVVPRNFLRKFVDIMDLVAQHSDYDPETEEQLDIEAGLSAEEKAMVEGQPLYSEEDEDLEPVTF